MLNLRDAVGVPLIVVSRLDDNLAAINTILREAGHAVHCTRVDEPAALEEAMAEHPPDLVLIFADEPDLDLTGLSGTIFRRNPPIPVLLVRQQVSELDQLLGVAVTPVRVMLESDNLTDVTVFKVGRLGVFSSRTLELRPGAYTAVGSRPGYRDVRRNFRVSPGNDAAVVVRCEERI